MWFLFFFFSLLAGSGYMCRFVIYGMHEHIHWKQRGYMYFLWSAFQPFAITRMQCLLQCISMISQCQPFRFVFLSLHAIRGTRTSNEQALQIPNFMFSQMLEISMEKYSRMSMLWKCFVWCIFINWKLIITRFDASQVYNYVVFLLFKWIFRFSLGICRSQLAICDAWMSHEKTKNRNRIIFVIALCNQILST